MKQKKTTELRAKSIEVLTKEATELRAQLMKIHVNIFSGEQKNLKEKMRVRHELSRVLGIITELENAKAKQQ